MALPPHWMDGVISRVLDTEDAEQIAQAIANSPQVLNAIVAGLKSAQDQKAREEATGQMVCGAGPAQMIRQRIVEAIASAR